MRTFSFALPSGFEWDVKTFAKQVKTKKWANDYARHLEKCAERLTTANTDRRQVIGGMLQTAFGANIGRQVEEKLSDKDLLKMESNIISAVYN